MADPHAHEWKEGGRWDGRPPPRNCFPPNSSQHGGKIHCYQYKTWLIYIKYYKLSNQLGSQLEADIFFILQGILGNTSPKCTSSEYWNFLNDDDDGKHHRNIGGIIRLESCSCKMLILANLILTGNQQWESAEWKRTRKSLGFWVAPPANWVPLHLYHQKNGSQFPKKSSHPKQLFPPMYITIIAGTLVTVLGTQVLSQGKVCSTSWSNPKPRLIVMSSYF